MRKNNVIDLVLKAAVSSALVSIVALVTMVNNSLLVGSSQNETYAGEGASSSRSLASVSLSSHAPYEIEKNHFSAALAPSTFVQSASLGRRASELELLTLGFLEGKYAVRLQNGKLRELEFSKEIAQGNAPKSVEDRSAFIVEHRKLFPVDFSKSVKIDTSKEGSFLIETFQLLDSISAPVARVYFQMDQAGRMLAMRILKLETVSK